MRSVHGMRTKPPSLQSISQLPKKTVAIQRNLVSFLQSKAPYVYFLFLSQTFYKAVKMRKSVRSASYLTTQPRTTQAPIMEQPQYLSTKLWVFLDIFQSSPSPPRTLLPGWVSPWASFSQALIQYPLIGWEFLVSFN